VWYSSIVTTGRRAVEVSPPTRGIDRRHVPRAGETRHYSLSRFRLHHDTDDAVGRALVFAAFRRLQAFGE